MSAALRYERVSSPDTGSMFGHVSVYNPEQMDDTTAIVGRPGELESTASDPVGFREIFNDPRLSPKQQKFCVVTLLTIGCITLLMLISLFAGFGKVLFDIGAREQSGKHGIIMIPNLRLQPSNVLYYSTRNRTANIRRYADEIHEYIQHYRDMQDASLMSVKFKNCSPTERSDPKSWCYFNVATEFGSACSRENNYGFDDDSPCVLFAFEDRLNWTPNVRPLTAFLPFGCRTQYQYSYNWYVNISYYPSLGPNSRMGGFYLNQIPSRQLKKENGDELISDETGDLMFTVPPLVMVKLSFTKLAGSFTIDCRIKDSVQGNEFSNIDHFKGQIGTSFDFSIVGDLPAST